MGPAGEITRHLRAVRDGETRAVDELFRLVYEQLRRMAHGQLGRGGPATLNTTALVHEAYLKLAGHDASRWHDRNHFFAVAARAMRQILVDHVRQRAALKRGGDRCRSTFRESQYGLDGRLFDLLALDEALDRLGQVSERLCRVVELRFFAGLSVDETATALQVTSRTVKRDWRKARAYLFGALHEPRPGRS